MLALPQSCVTFSISYSWLGVTIILNIHLSTLNIQTPGMPTLLVLIILVMFEVLDPGTVTEIVPTPALIPTSASVPYSPSIPSELSPVVHCIS